MNNERDCWTVDAMEKYGGSFVKCLSDLARCADQENLTKIKATWSGYWEQYEVMGKKMEEESDLI